MAQSQCDLAVLVALSYSLIVRDVPSTCPLALRARIAKKGPAAVVVTAVSKPLRACDVTGES
jgi:hypothetical protein